jgi:hypothetical protein
MELYFNTNYELTMGRVVLKEYSPALLLINIDWFCEIDGALFTLQITQNEIYFYYETEDVFERCSLAYSVVEENGSWSLKISDDSLTSFNNMDSFSDVNQYIAIADDARSLSLTCKLNGEDITITFRR